MSEAVRLFQERIGVTPDGIWGKNTAKATAEYWGLGPFAAANFFGQLAYETGNFKYFEENLNYSATGLRTVFPKYFKTQTIANLYARKPEAIANRVYANRMGNGSETSGDGWKYRGRGAIQLTGKKNYENFKCYCSVQSRIFYLTDVVLDPEAVASKYAFDAAKWYFDYHNLWKIARRDVSRETVRALTKAINGGTNGLEARIKKVQEYYANR